MADVMNGSPTTSGAPGGASGATNNGGGQTRSAIMANIRSAPQPSPTAPKINTPTVTAPTQPVAPKPPTVDEAVKLEMGGGGGLDPTQPPGTEGIEQDATGDVDPNAEAAIEEPIDYAQRYQEIMDSGDLHESLYDKMGIAKIDGKEYPVTVKEAFQGYMRRSDHSKAMNALQQQEQSFKAETQKFANVLGSMGDRPELALEVFVERYGDAWIDKVVEIRTAQVKDYEETIISAGHRVMTALGITDPEVARTHPQILRAMAQTKERLDRQQALEKENRALKRKAEEFEKAQAQQTSKQQEVSYGQQFQATIKRFSDAALKAEGLPVNELSKSDLQQTVAQLLIAKNQGLPDDQRSYSITQDLVREAASILKETREDARRGQAQEPPLPPRQGMGVGSGAAVRPNGGPQTRSQLIGALRGGQR